MRSLSFILYLTKITWKATSTVVINVAPSVKTELSPRKSSNQSLPVYYDLVYLPKKENNDLI